MELSNTEIKIVVKNMAREMVKRATAKNADKSDYQKFRDAFFKKHGIKSEADAKKLAGTEEGKRLDEAYKKEYGEYMQKSPTPKNAALRTVAVTYSDGTTITTSMAAHLSDADIKNYFRAGREFNIGSGGKDKMVKVKSVKILNATSATAKNAPRLRGIYKDKNEAQARVDRENAKKENANEIHTIEKVGDDFHVVADKK